MPSDIDSLLASFDPVTDLAAVERYATDWTRDITGQPRAILRPRNSAEVARIMAVCAEVGVPVTPQGGHTGLVGGGTPSPGGEEVVISLERLNRVRAIDPVNYSMIVEAGCILENIQAAAAAADRLFPLSLGAQGSCQIGGNIATNAGGINVLRYGTTRGLVLGLEVVLPDGRIWNGLKAVHKDNTGYDLKQIFLGSEGTLGIITAACLKLFPRPSQIVTAFLAVPSVEAAIELYALARRDLSDLLSALELIPRVGLDLAVEAISDLRDPLSAPAPHYVLMEASATGLLDLADLVDRFLETAFAEGYVTDGVRATNNVQARDFWRIREGLVEGQARRGRHLRTDVSVPISKIIAFLNDAKGELARAAPETRCLAYGHVGDGNIHFNVLPRSNMAENDKIALLHRCEELIFAAVDRVNGSISAEHGIGRVKRPAFLQRASAIEIEMMLGLKTMLDPNWLMNPGRILERSS